MKDKNNLSKDENYKKFCAWREKIKILNDGASNLEKGIINKDDYSIFVILSFFLKLSFVELELKQLITILDIHYNQAKLRTPKYIDDKKWTLGMLSNELKKYKGKILCDLIKNLSSFIKHRNEFIHKLYNVGSMKTLILESKKA